MPPEEIVRILDAPPPPFVNVSPDGEWIVLTGRLSMPSIEDMAQPMLRLGGRRINPATTGVFGPSTGRNPGLTTTLSVMNVSDGSQRPVDAPEGGWGVPRFAPGGDRFAITRTVSDGIELWMGSVSEASVRRLTGERLNGVRGEPCDWMPGGDELLCTLVPSGRGPSPMAPSVPGGPVIQEAEGRNAPVRTYQDLIEDSHGEALFEYFATSRPALVDADDGTVRTLAEPGIWDLSRSPSGAYILAERTVRPFSYLVPDSRFPKELEIWSRDGGVVAEVAAIPLADGAPIGGVEEGPRGHRWIPGEDHTLMWVEALDGGDPWTEAENRDRVMRLTAPFDGEAGEVARTALRYAGLSRGEDGLALLTETWRRSQHGPHLADRPGWRRRTPADLGTQLAGPLQRSRNAGDAARGERRVAHRAGRRLDLPDGCGSLGCRRPSVPRPHESRHRRERTPLPGRSRQLRVRGRHARRRRPPGPHPARDPA